MESLEARQLLSLPAGWASKDIGTPTDPAPAGSANESGGTFTVIAGGSDIWNNADQFHFAYKQLTGDGTIVANVASMTSPSTNEWAKGSIMMRTNLDPNSNNVMMTVTGDHGVQWQERKNIGGASDNFTYAGPRDGTWLKITRAGNSFTAAYSTDSGATWIDATDANGEPVVYHLNTGNTMYVGLANTSHINGTLNTVTYDNVKITSTPATGAPNAPSGLTTQGPPSGASIILSWLDNASNETGFVLDRATDPDFSQNVVHVPLGADTYTYTDASVSVGTQYYYRIKASNAAGSSEFSDTASFVGGAITGTTGRYWGNTGYAGAPNDTRLDPQINFTWGDPTRPAPNTPATYFSARWTGKITAPQTGTYTFLARTDDDGYAWVDSTMVASSPGVHGIQDGNVIETLDLVAGRSYNFQMDMQQGGGGAGAFFTWILPDGTQQDIPATAFTAKMDVPTAPTGVTLTQNPGEVLVEWTDKSNSEVEFQVWRATKADMSDAVMVAWTRPGITSASDVTFDASTKYYYTVKAWNYEGSSDSAVKSITTPADIKAPGNIIATWYNSWDPDFNFDPNLLALGWRPRMVFQHLEQQIDFSGAEPDSPLSGFTGPGVINPDYHAARWEGTITPDVTGEYIFGTSSDDGIRLYVNGILATGKPATNTGWDYRGQTANAPQERSAPIHLEAGVPVPFQVIYFEGGGGWGAHLFWAAKDSTGADIKTEEKVPSSAFDVPDKPAVSTNLSFTATPISLAISWKNNAINETTTQLQVSTDGTTWTTVQTFRDDDGGSNAGGAASNTPPSLITNPNGQAVTKTYTLTGLSPNTTRYIRVVDSNVRGDVISAVLTTKTLDVPPGSITATVTTPVSGDTNQSAEGNLDWAHWGYNGNINGYDGAAGPYAFVGANGAVAWSAGEHVTITNPDADAFGYTWQVIDSTNPEYAGATTSAKSASVLNAFAPVVAGAVRADNDGRATWAINIPEAGDYKLYVRRKCLTPNTPGRSNSFYVADALDSEASFHIFENIFPIQGGVNEYSWVSNSNTGSYAPGQTVFTGVTPGRHTLTISMREPHYVIDRIVLSKNQNLTPAELDALANSQYGPARPDDGISKLTPIGTGTITAIQTPGTTFSWTGGVLPNSAVTATNSGLAVSGTGNGFQFSAPALSADRKLRVFVGVDGTATGQLTATLSDGSVAPFTAETLTATGGLKTAVYTLQFRSGLEGKRIVIDWKQIGGTGNVILMGADLVEFQAPTAPKDLTAINGSTTYAAKVLLNWTDTSVTEKGFVVERSETSGSGFAPIATLPANSTSYSDNDSKLVDGKKYYYRVKALGLVADSNFSNEVGIVAQGPIVGTGTGLRGLYYNEDDNTQLFTNYITARLDPIIDFDFDVNAWQRPAGFNHDQEFIDWKGFVQAQVTGMYTFGTASDDQSRVYLNNEVFPNVDNWVYQGRTFKAGTPVLLEAGQKYPIRVQFTQGGGGANMTLFWSGPGMTGAADSKYGNAGVPAGWRVVPTSQLYEPVATAVPTAPANVTLWSEHGQNYLTWNGTDAMSSAVKVLRSTSENGPFTTVATLSWAATSYTDADPAMVDGQTYYYKIANSNSFGDVASDPVNAVFAKGSLPAPWQHIEIGVLGNPGLPGDATFDPATQGGQFTVIGGGADIWDTTDAFQFVYQKLPNTDMVFTVRVANAEVTGGGALYEWAKIGLVIRDGLAAGSASTVLALTGAHGAQFMARFQDGGTYTSSVATEDTDHTAPYWLRLVKKGSNIKAYVSSDGKFNNVNTTTQVGDEAGIDLPLNTTDIYIGLGVSSVDNTVTAEGKFDHVTISTADATEAPAAPTNVSFAPASDKIQVKWVDNSTAETGFKIYRSSDPTAGFGTPIAVTGPGATSFIDTTVTAGATYYYRVVATNARAATPDSAFAQGGPVTAATPPVSLNYPNFSGVGSDSGWKLNGSAVEDSGMSGDGVIRLTQAQNSQTGSAFTTTRYPIAGFKASFDFQVTNSNGADGFTFTFQNDSRGPTALGGGGGSLGYAGITNSAYIKFDFYPNNTGDDAAVNQTWLYGTTPDGVPDAGVDLQYTAGYRIDGGDRIHVTLDYDGTNLVETITNLDNPGKPFSLTYYNVNLPAMVGGQTAYIGFTGATGGLNSAQDILNFQYQTVSTKQPLAISGTGGNDAINLKFEGGNIVWSVNGVEQSKPLANVSSITVDGLSGTDTLTLKGSGSESLVATDSQITFGGVQINLAGVEKQVFDLAAVNVQDVAQISLSKGGNKLLKLGSLTIGPNGTLDLADNDLILTATPETKAAALAALSNAIKSARGNGNWAGKGLTSSEAKAMAAAKQAYTGLAVMLNEKAGAAILSSFDGQAVGVNDILVKYTWNGDVNLDGVVDAADYFLVDSGFITQQGQYRNGDLNLDGQVDAADYFLIDSAFIGQTGVLAAAPVKPVEAASVLQQLFSVKPVL